MKVQPLSSLLITLLIGVSVFSCTSPVQRIHCSQNLQSMSNASAGAPQSPIMPSNSYQMLFLFLLPDHTDVSRVTDTMRQIFSQQGIPLFSQTDLSKEADGWCLTTLDAQSQRRRTYVIQPNQSAWAVYNPRFPVANDDFIYPNQPLLRDAYISDNFPELKPLTQNLAERVALQRVYDIYSWQVFLGLNWRANDDGQQDEPQWATWKNDYEIFKKDGSPPAPWVNDRELVTTLAKGDKCKDLTRVNRMLFNLSATSALTPDDLRLDHTREAFSYPLWDQNGNRVYYEILVNEYEFNFIVESKLYNLDGQIAYSQQNQGQPITFSPGVSRYPDEPGPIELKLAWKIIDRNKGDIAERFYTKPALVYVPDEPELCKQVTVGLVGMHIAHKALSSHQWIWSTFEQVDNLHVSEETFLEYNKRGQTLRPSFYDPLCPLCPVNVPPTPEPESGLQKTQVTRLIPIADGTATLNQHVQAKLKSQDSVWQYYELIGTQYATSPASTSTLSSQLPGSVINKSGGLPAPVYLINSVMETYFQHGNQPAKEQESPGSENDQLIFGSQSCMGCHSTAGIASAFEIDQAGEKKAIFASDMADFSWLFQQKAHWQQNKP